MIHRRAFLTLLGGAAAAWPLGVGAQQPAIPRIGFLNSASPDAFAYLVRAFHAGLNEAGYFEGRNVLVEYRWAEGHNDRLPALAADLIHRQVSLIFATGPAALAAKAATAVLPVVFYTGGDPVGMGLVARVNRPGGNVTGITSLGEEVAPKRLELLHELLPDGTTAALLINPTFDTAEAQAKVMLSAARALGLKLHVLNASTDTEIVAAFAMLSGLGAGGLVIGSDPFYTSRIELFSQLSLQHRVPTIFQYREFPAAGGLMSYGGSATEGYRLAGLYTGRIIKGEKAGDLPVQQETRVQLIINVKTAKALGISFPITLLGRADEVIE